MLGGHQHIDIVPALDAVVKAAEQAVGVRGQVEPHHIRLFVGHMVQEAGVLMGEAVVVLLPDVGGEDVVEGGDLLPPGQLPADLQPLGVLGDHRVHDADKGLIAVEQAVPPGEEVALQPALAQMLRQHSVHHPAVRLQLRVPDGIDGVHPSPAACLKHGGEGVGGGLVRSKDPEIPGLPVEGDEIPHIAPQHAGVLSLYRAGLGHLHPVLPEVWGAQIPEQQPAVGMRIGSHAPLPLGGQLPQGGDQGPVFVKQLLRPVAAQPALQLLDAAGLAVVDGNGDLVGAPAALHRLPVHLLGASPALGGAEYDHGPAGAGGVFGGTGVLLDPLDLPHRPVQGGGHLLVHLLGLVPLHKAGLPAAALEEHLGLLVGDAGEQGGVGELEAVEVENGQHRAVRDGVEELVGVPGGGQGGGLRFAVSHHTGGDEAGVVHDRPEGVGQGVAQFSPLVDGAGGVGGGLAGDPAGEGELPEQPLHTGGILADVGIDLAVRAVQIVLGHHGVSTVSGAGEIDHIQVIFDDGPVEMGINEVLARAGAPMPHDGALQMFLLQRLPQQGIVQQIELAGGQIVGGTPIGVNGLDLFPGQGVLFGHSSRRLRGGLDGFGGFWHGVIPPWQTLFSDELSIA